MNRSLEKFKFIVDRLIENKSEKSDFKTIDELKSFFNLTEIIKFIETFKTYLEDENNLLKFELKNLSLFSNLPETLGEIVKDDILIMLSTLLIYLNNIDEIFQDEDKRLIYINQLAHPLVKELPLSIDFWSNAKLEDIETIMLKHIKQDIFTESSICDEVHTLHCCLSKIIKKHQMLVSELKRERLSECNENSQ